MEKVNVRYAVVILNYNTIDDAVNAAKSVICNAVERDYVICIADNASSKEFDRRKLSQIRLTNTIICQLEKNTGYASGNNAAISKVLKNYQPDYIAVMNPDVLLLKKGTIEGMITAIEKQGKGIVGGQPLVWNCYYGNDAAIQQNIRRVPDYKELCIVRFYPLKIIFRKKYRRYIYADKMPYNGHIRYYVPSGAFFIIREHEFRELGYFDPNTFLYYEEHILGFKLRKAGKKLLFMPEYMVRHEHGKSTGHNKYFFNKHAHQAGLDSCLYYAENYLGINQVQKRLLIILDILNRVSMQILSGIMRFMKNR